MVVGHAIMLPARKMFHYSSRFKSHLTEFGLGYYLPFKNKFLFETYGGYGKSWIENHYDYFVGNGYSTLGSSCFFIQPAFTFRGGGEHVKIQVQIRTII